MSTVPVTFVSSHAKLGGAEMYLQRLVEALGPAWIDGLICLEGGPFVERLRERGHEVAVVPTGRRFGLITGAIRLRRRLPCRPGAVIHASGVKAALVAVMATPRARVVWVKHDFSWDGRLARLVARRCAMVVAVSHAVARTFAGCGVEVRVVHHGMTVPELDRERAELKVRALAGRGPRLGVVGRMETVKGQLEMVEVMPSLLARCPDLQLLLIGDESAHEADYGVRVRDRVAELAIGHAVQFLGQRPDAVEIMSVCSAVVVLSRPDSRGMGREGFGLVALEAMMVGTPVVAYADGAIPEVLGDGGVLVPAGDRPALVGALQRILTDPELSFQVAQRGRRRSQQRFSFEGMLTAMRRAYVDAA